MPKPRICTLDIETAPMEVFVWALHVEHISIDQIIKDWSILSFAYKWLGEPKVYFHGTGGRGASRVRDDKALCAKLHALLSEADIVITQNGVSFDIKKINSRLAIQGYPPYPKPKVIDTRLVALQKFGHSSTGLAWLTKIHGVAEKSSHKKYPGFELHKECLLDNPAAWREMEQYNKQDVVSTEELYLELRGWIDGHPNVAAYGQPDAPQCPKCGSFDLQSRGVRTTNTGQTYRYQCQKCHGWAYKRQPFTKPNHFLQGN